MTIKFFFYGQNLGEVRNLTLEGWKCYKVDSPQRRGFFFQSCYCTRTAEQKL